MTDHPIRPPHELVQQWVSLACELEGYETWQDLATEAARWGADQQLEQCVAWLDGYEHEGWAAEQMRNDCRPKPPSLKDKLKEAIYGENLDKALRLVEQLDESL